MQFYFATEVLFGKLLPVLLSSGIVLLLSYSEWSRLEEVIDTMIAGLAGEQAHQLMLASQEQQLQGFSCLLNMHLMSEILDSFPAMVHCIDSIDSTTVVTSQVVRCNALGPTGGHINHI